MDPCRIKREENHIVHEADNDCLMFICPASRLYSWCHDEMRLLLIAYLPRLVLTWITTVTSPSPLTPLKLYHGIFWPRFYFSFFVSFQVSEHVGNALPYLIRNFLTLTELLTKAATLYGVSPSSPSRTCWSAQHLYCPSLSFPGVASRRCSNYACSSN